MIVVSSQCPSKACLGVQYPLPSGGRDAASDECEYLSRSEPVEGQIRETWDDGRGSIPGRYTVHVRGDPSGPAASASPRLIIGRHRSSLLVMPGDSSAGSPSIGDSGAAGTRPRNQLPTSTEPSGDASKDNLDENVDILGHVLSMLDNLAPIIADAFLAGSGKYLCVSLWLNDSFLLFSSNSEPFIT